MKQADVKTILDQMENAGGAGILDVLPGDLASVEGLISEIRRKGNSYVIIACVVLADAKKYFSGDKSGAIAWCKWGQDKCGYSREYVHHMRAVGDMIFALIEHESKTCNTDADSKTCNTVMRLMSLDFCKLLSLTRLPIEKIKEIIDTVQLTDMSRDEVREIVRMTLGEKPQEKNKKTDKDASHPYFGDMYQPQLFEDLVDDIASWGEDRTAEAASHADVKPGKTMRAAISLLDVDIRKLEAGQALDDAYDPEQLLQILNAAVNQITQLISKK